ncbi:MAG: cohesin domain-containing protein, partial [Coprococcus sp.]
ACVLTMMLFMLHTTYAATVAFSVEVPSTTVVVGDTVEIKVSINAADQALSSYSYNITYDSTLLKAVSGGTVESEGTVSYSQANVKPGDAMTATFTFTAIASGTASIETSAVEVISDTEESIDMTPSYNSVTISDKSAAASTEALHLLSAIPVQKPSLQHLLH